MNGVELLNRLSVEARERVIPSPLSRFSASTLERLNEPV